MSDNNTLAELESERDADITATNVLFYFYYNKFAKENIMWNKVIKQNIIFEITSIYLMFILLITAAICRTKSLSRVEVIVLWARLYVIFPKKNNIGMRNR